MSPQPKNTPTTDEQPPTGAATATTDAPVERTPENLAAGLIEPDTAAERQIARAGQLERDRATLQEKIGKNRDYLRLMDSNEELTEDQGAWLDAFYPTKEKGEQRSKEEIEATRKVKEAARKGS